MSGGAPCRRAVRSALHPRGAALELKLLSKGCQPPTFCTYNVRTSLGVCEATAMQAKLRRSVARLWGLKQLSTSFGSFNSVFLFRFRAKVLEKTQEASRLGQPYKPLPDGAPHLRAHVIIHSLSTLVSMPAVHALAGVRCDVVAHGVKREPLKVVELFELGQDPKPVTKSDSGRNRPQPGSRGSRWVQWAVARQPNSSEATAM